MIRPVASPQTLLRLLGAAEAPPAGASSIVRRAALALVRIIGESVSTEGSEGMTYPDHLNAHFGYRLVLGQRNV